MIEEQYIVCKARQLTLAFAGDRPKNSLVVPSTGDCEEEPKTVKLISLKS